MNLNYVKTFLEGLLGSTKPEYYDNRIHELLDKIEAYQEVEEKMLTIQQILKTVNEYRDTYLTLIDEFNCIPSTNNKLKTYKLQEMVCVLSGVHTYLFSVLEGYNLKDPSLLDKDLYKHLRNLEEKKKYYNSEKFAWITVLKSLIQESSRDVEIAKIKSNTIIKHAIENGG